jgi:branched-chain amino acid transport system ATP-binding protein
MIALQARGLQRHYAGVHALRGVDLCLPEGQVHGLIGPNGAGKTTLLDLLSGRSLCDGDGHVELMGRDISRLDARQRRRAGLSRSFQRSEVFPSFTVAEQLRLAAAVDRVPASAWSDVMHTLELDGVAQHRAGDLSHGEQRRLDLALALAGQPRVVLLDEPAAGLSRGEAMALAGMLLRLAQQRGTTVLLVEHDVDFVFAVCSHVTVLHLGRVLAEGPAEQVRGDAAVIDAYLGRRA